MIHVGRQHTQNDPNASYGNGCEAPMVPFLVLKSNIRSEIQRNDSDSGQFPTSLYDPTDPKTIEEHNRAQALFRRARARAREDEASGRVSKRARLVERGISYLVNSLSKRLAPLLISTISTPHYYPSYVVPYD